MSEGKKKFLRVRSVLKGYQVRINKMEYIEKMKCSVVVGRARHRAGRTGTEMLTEMVEWRTDLRNLSVLVKKITDTLV